MTAASATLRLRDPAGHLGDAAVKPLRLGGSPLRGLGVVIARRRLWAHQRSCGRRKRCDTRYRATSALRLILVAWRSR